MKRIANRGLPLLMAILMCVSLLSVAQPHSHAADNWVKNWGVRGTVATELSDSALAFYTGEYTYVSLSQLSGGTSYENAPSSALYSALQDLMSGKHSTITSYDATKDMYQYTDCQNGGGTISSFYSGVAIGPEWGSSPSWNREHTWPNSKGEGDAENDIMMLRPTATSENSGRGNNAYGESDGFYDPNSVSNGNYNLRGDVARIMLYVYTRWGNTGSMWGEDGVIESQDILLKWMEQDPVDTWEMGRNDSVQSITGTRNVYVDYPELAFLLFGQDIPPSITTPSNGQIPSSHTCSYGAGVVTPPTCTNLGYTTYTCTDSNCGYSFKAEYTAKITHSFSNGTCSVCGATEAVGITLVTDVTDLQPGDRIVIVAKDADKALGAQKTYNRAAAAVTKTGNTVTFNDDTQIIILEEGSKAGTFAFQVDNGYLYAASSSSNHLKTEGTLSDNSSWSIAIAADGTATVKAQGTNSRNWLRYNSSSTLFSTYSSGQEDILIYELPGCTHNWTAATCTAPETCTLCGLTQGEAVGHAFSDGVCSVCGLKVTEQVKIYYATEDLYLTTTISDTKLAGGTDGEAAVWTKTYIDGYYTFAIEGKYLTSGSSGNSLTLSDSLTDCGKWELEEAVDGYYLRNVGANYYGSYNQYLEYYSGFTTYGFNSSKANIYTFQLKEVASDCQHDWSDATCTTPKTCDLCGTTEGEALGHTYGEPAFTWSENSHSATCTITCTNCAEGTQDHTVTKNCVVTLEFAEGKVTIKADADGKIDVLTFSIDNSSSEQPDDFTTNAVVIAATYNADGRMTDIQFLEEGEVLIVSDNIKVFFLNKNYAPILFNTGG